MLVALETRHRPEDVERYWREKVACLVCSGSDDETRFARWSEVDAAILTVPPDRMKGGDGHTVPLTPMALEAVYDLHKFDHEKREASGVGERLRAIVG